MSAEIGLIGLGTMGASLALNIAEKGFGIAVWNRTTKVNVWACRIDTKFNTQLFARPEAAFQMLLMNHLFNPPRKEFLDFLLVRTHVHTYAL